jgi:4-hydroxy-tetrahydrodipicolinate synthase
VLNTPFAPDGSLDLYGLKAHVDYALDAGVTGFLVNGLAAEVEYLSSAEREAVARAVVEQAGNTPVIAGLGSAADSALLDSAVRYLGLGCVGLLVNGADVLEQRLLEVLRSLDDLHPPFLMLQDWDATGSGVPMPTLLRYVESVPSLTWLKIEVASPGPKYSELIEKGPETLRVAGGWAVREMIDGLDRGVHAFMPTALHRTYVQIFEHHAAGRRDECRALFDRLRPILDFSNRDLGTSVRFFKELLSRQHVYETPFCRMPSALIPPNERELARRLLLLAIGLENSSNPP